MRCEGICRNVTVTLGTHMFQVDFYILPIFGAEAVLGVQWLAQKGHVTFDNNQL